MVCINNVSSSSVLDLQMVIPLLLLCRQQGEELHGETYGMRNRRRNIYASPELWMIWLGCLRTTTAVGTCRENTGLASTTGHRPQETQPTTHYSADVLSHQHISSMLPPPRSCVWAAYIFSSARAPPMVDTCKRVIYRSWVLLTINLMGLCKMHCVDQ